jgi:hypothetical protein
MLFLRGGGRRAYFLKYADTTECCSSTKCIVLSWAVVIWLPDLTDKKKNSNFTRHSGREACRMTAPYYLINFFQYTLFVYLQVATSSRKIIFSPLHLGLAGGEGELIQNCIKIYRLVNFPDKFYLKNHFGCKVKFFIYPFSFIGTLSNMIYVFKSSYWHYTVRLLFKNLPIKCAVLTGNGNISNIR